MFPAEDVIEIMFSWCGNAAQEAFS